MQDLSSVVPLWYKMYSPLVFAASAVYFVEWIKALNYWRFERTTLSRNFVLLCGAASAYSLFFWMRMNFPAISGSLVSRYLTWIISLVANTAYLETICAYLKIEGKILNAIRSAMMAFILLFIFFTLHFLLTGKSLLFTEIAPHPSNFFNQAIFTNSSTPTNLMKLISLFLGALVIVVSGILLRLALKSPNKEWILKVGVTFTFFTVLNELLNSMGYIESVNLIFLSKGLEIFRISEFINRTQIRKLEALKMEVGQLSKQAATAFINSGLLHDIRNPLTIIKGNGIRAQRHLVASADSAGSADSALQLPSQHPSPPNPLNMEIIGNAMNKILAQTDRIENMINSYLDLLRSSRSAGTSINDLSEIVHEAVELTGPRHIALGVSPIRIDPIPPVKISGVRVHIEMVLANIINNAVEAIASQKDSAVSIRFPLAPKVIKIEITNPGKIDDDILKKISGNESFSSKGNKGNGIGLRIAHQLCIANQGSLDIYNANDNTHVVVTLPQYN